MIGVIFSIYSLGGMIASPIVGQYIDKTGPKYFITRGLIILGLSLVFFGLLDFLESSNTIAALATILRFIQGISAGCVSTSCYSIATNDYPGSSAKIIGNLEASFGLGLIIGPVIGAFTDSLLNF